MVNSLRSSIFNALRFTIDLHGKIHNSPCTVNYQSASLVNFSKAIKLAAAKFTIYPLLFRSFFRLSVHTPHINTPLRVPPPKPIRSQAFQSCCGVTTSIRAMTGSHPFQPREQKTIKPIIFHLIYSPSIDKGPFPKITICN